MYINIHQQGRKSVRFEQCADGIEIKPCGIFNIRLEDKNIAEEEREGVVCYY